MERRFAREHLVQDAREAVDVAGGTRLRVAARLLGAHVLRCAHGEADLGHRVPANPAGFDVSARARHTEVCEDRVPIGKQIVLGFDIAMDEPFAMREIEASPDFLCDAQRVLQRQLPGRVQPLAERAAGHMRLHVVEPPRGFAGVDQGNDVRMRQLGGDADFTQEAVRAERGRDFWSQDFDRDFAPVFLFLGEVYRRHAAASQFSLDGVAIGERGGDGLSGLRMTHGAKS